jgi:hypothetical protein
LTQFKDVPVEPQYADEAFAVLVPPICEPPSQSSGCMSPILRYPISNIARVRRSRRLSTKNLNLLTDDYTQQQQNENALVSTSLTCYEAYRLFETHIQAPKSKALPISVQYGKMDLTVSVGIKKHLHSHRNASLGALMSWSHTL